MISSTEKEAPHVIDGLLYHETELKIEEHYTDTAGFVDHIFAMCHMLGFRFAPRIKSIGDRRIYTFNKPTEYSHLSFMISGKVNVKKIRENWDDLLRLNSSVRRGTVTVSLILKKLASYPRQNGLSWALRETGRIERTLYTLGWLQSPELRRRVHVGLNKGEAKNALAQAVFFNRLGKSATVLMKIKCIVPVALTYLLRQLFCGILFIFHAWLIRYALKEWIFRKNTCNTCLHLDGNTSL